MADYIADIATHLENEGVADKTDDLFVGVLPDDEDGSYDNIVCIFETGGSPPNMNIPDARPTFQVFVRNSSYAAGRAKIEEVRDALHQKIGLTVGSTHFYNIFAQSEPYHFSRDDTETGGREEFTLNFTAWVRDGS